MIEATAQIHILYVSLFIGQSHSLKDKRMVLKSIKDKVRHQFNVSIAEIDGLDKWQVATLAFAAIGTDGRRMDTVLQNILELVRGYHEVEVCEHHIERC